MRPGMSADELWGSRAKPPAKIVRGTAVVCLGDVEAMIEQVSRDTGLRFQLDTNRINSRGRLPSISQLEKWYADGVIELAVCEVVSKELESEGDPRRVKKVRSYLATETLAETQAEQRLLRQIGAIVGTRPDGRATNDGLV